MKNYRRQQEAGRLNDRHELQPRFQSTPVVSRRALMEASLLDVTAKQFASSAICRIR